jgi:ribonuclease HI
MYVRAYCIDGCHAWTDGSFRISVGLEWIITADDTRAGPAIAQGARTLGTKQTAFDAEVAAIKETLKWFETSPYLHLTVHSDSTSAIASAGHTAAGPGQKLAKRIQKMVTHPTPLHFQTAKIVWEKGHAGTPGNERTECVCLREKSGSSSGVPCMDRSKHFRMDGAHASRMDFYGRRVRRWNARCDNFRIMLFTISFAFSFLRMYYL